MEAILFFVTIFGNIICGIFSASLANSRNRNNALWFFLGLFFGVIAVIIIAILPKKKEPRK